ncbi:uncharacterized protein LOC132548303 [Ylistrum balloti]|uniref:uncharacterized protein LOC132548303 n=1 Tax=Ylistrum balloti TaxID=509963 RepID=UPI002905CBED|nr:uncharacterized protein LOC132548303 [Ylistrum balloti]
MAQYKVYDPEEMIECPYDKVHMIAAKRMQYHMMKCRRNHPGADFAVCPYNARHEVRRPELRYHMVNCPDKARLEPSILHEQNKENRDGQYFKGNTDLPRYADSSNFESVENWDEEIPSVARVGVDPNYFIRLNARNTAGMSRKEKKVYMSQVNKPSEERWVPEPEEEEEEEQTLRRPHAKPETYMSYNSNAATHVGHIPPSTSVLALSLSRSGVGRGQIGGRGVAQVNPQGPQPIGRGQQGRGRSVGRGLVSRPPPGYAATNTNTNSIQTQAIPPGQPLGQSSGQMSSLLNNVMPSVGQSSGLSNNVMPSVGQSSGLPNNVMPSVGQSSGLPNNTMPSVGQSSGLPYNVMPSVGQSSGLPSNTMPSVGQSSGLPNNVMPSVGQSSGLPNNMMPSVGRSSGLPNSMMPSVFSMGLGRGSGRGSILRKNGAAPSFVIPNVMGSPGNASVANSSSSDADDGNVSTSSTLSDNEKKKEKRRLEKKLRQIELLDAKVAEGYKLTSEEEIKCRKKDEILGALQDLKI